MTPKQRIERQILINLVANHPDAFDGYRGGEGLGDPKGLTAEQVDEAMEYLVESDYEDALQDEEQEFRGSGEESGIPCRDCFSRHYESDEVARVLDDGTAVGWTYWYGGGKYGEPEAIEWMDGAYEVEVKQETRIVNVYTKKA